MSVSSTLDPDRPPVFIIGGSRTGSEMLKTMLCEGGEQDFVDELFLLCPGWLHPDLESGLRSQVGDPNAPGVLDRLLEYLFSGKPYGWIWQKADEQLDRELLRAELSGKRLDLRAIFLGIMRSHAIMRGRTRIGAKFPTHYSYTRRLLEWFPGCKLLHTTREPKAVYASQAAKYLASDDPAWRRGYKRFQQFVHINLQISWTGRLHRRLAGLPNYRLVRYEDVIRDPATALRSICGFLDLEFRDAMLSPKRYGSSFDRGGSQGVASVSLDRWREELAPATIWLMDALHPVARRRFGYGDEPMGASGGRP